VVVASVVVASVVVASVVVVGVVVSVEVESVSSSQTYPARSKEALADQPAAPSARNRTQKSSSRI
jgi:hypothetical protein